MEGERRDVPDWEPLAVEHVNKRLHMRTNTPVVGTRQRRNKHADKPPEDRERPHKGKRENNNTRHERRKTHHK